MFSVISCLGATHDWRFVAGAIAVCLIGAFSTEQRPQVGFALWKETIADAAIAREWVANVGSRSGYERVAHLLCEMGRRLQAARLASDSSFEWPVAAADVADAMGLSIVHLSRVYQQLRSDGLIGAERNVVKVLDWQRLQAAGDIHPDYLFLSPVVPPEQQASF